MNRRFVVRDKKVRFDEEHVLQARAWDQEDIGGGQESSMNLPG